MHSRKKLEQIPFIGAAMTVFFVADLRWRVTSKTKEVSTPPTKNVTDEIFEKKTCDTQTTQSEHKDLEAVF